MSGPAPAAIKTICAWCGVVLTDGPAAPVSHGICEGCRAGLRARLVRGRLFWLFECDHCGAEFMGPPVTSEEQRWHMGAQALAFCSTSCLDDAAEAAGVRQGERSLQ